MTNSVAFSAKRCFKVHWKFFAGISDLPMLFQLFFLSEVLKRLSFNVLADGVIWAKLNVSHRISFISINTSICINYLNTDVFIFSMVFMILFS